MNIISHKKQQWGEYCEKELLAIRPLLAHEGFVLEEEQPHIRGERYLMQAVTTISGIKIILLGRDLSGTKVVIKATRDVRGRSELIHERTCREVLKKIDFAGEVFHTPKERAFIEHNGYTISIQNFIEQECTFLERPLETQFEFALRAFKAQESAHATTLKHRRLIGSIFGIRDAKTYLTTATSFVAQIHEKLDNDDINKILQKALETLTSHENIIEQYTGFLTHTDFVPHNVRIVDGTMYLLDHSSLTFGNKYEGWARFINFMTLYNPPLQRALEEYVRLNRTEEESVALRMMRIYRLSEIIWYYVRTLEKSEENLLVLNTERIHFWTEILSCVLNEKEVENKTLEVYKTRRDSLRSAEEKNRQRDLH